MRNYNELNDNEKKMVTKLNDFWKENPELRNYFCDVFESKLIVKLQQYARQQKEEA